MAKELKQLMIRQLEAGVGALDSCVVVDYKGLDSEKTQDLRTSLRKRGVRMRVVHNRLARRAFAGKGAPETFQGLLRGPTAVLYGEDGALSASKSIVEWRKKNADLLKIKGGLLGGQMLGVSDVEKLAAIPDRETLLGGVVARMLGPIAVLANAASSLLAHLAGSAKARHADLSKDVPAGGEAAPGAAG